MNHTRPLTLSILLLVILLLPTQACALTILYFNDIHEIAPLDEGRRGGLARVAGAIASERAGDEPVVVLIGGDLAGGTLFGLLRGEPIVDVLNRIGIDAATFGQHEFDHGVDQARRLVGRSDFPWLTANLTETDGTPFAGLDRFLILEVEALRVGVFGITTAMDTTRHEDQVIEQDAISSARAAVAALNSAGVDLIVALTQQSPEADLEMVRAVPGIDLVLGEESSETVSRIDFLAGTYVARSAGNVSSLIRAQWLGPPTSDWRLSVVPIDAQTPEQPEIAELSAHYSTVLAARLAAPIRPTERPWSLSRETARSRETALGQLVADAYRQAMNSDLALATGGGLRADLRAQAPALTLADVAAVLPFSNSLVRLQISGEQLRILMEQALSGHPEPRNAFPLISGFDVHVDPEASPGMRVQALVHQGREIAADQVLTLATPLFLAEGGDGYSLLKDLQRDRFGPLDRDAVAQFLNRLPELRQAGDVPPRLIGLDAKQIRAR